MSSPREMLDQFLLVLFRRKWVILAVFVSIVVGVAGYTYFPYPLYRATVTILVHENPRQQLILFHDIATPAQSNFRINPAENLIEISCSTDLARKIVKEHQLDDRLARRSESPRTVREVFWYCVDAVTELPCDVLEFVGLLEDSGPKYEYDAARLLLDEGQEIRHIRDTELVKLSVWEEDPELACQIANRLGELLIEKTVTMSQSKASTAYEFTKERTAVVGQELGRIESELATVKTEQGLVGLEQQLLLTLSRLDAARTEYDGVIQEEKSLQSRLVEIRRQLQSVEPQIPVSTVVSQNPLRITLKSSLYETEIELASREAELADANPEIARLRARAGRAQEKLGEEDLTIVESETTAVNPLHQGLVAEISSTETGLEAWAGRRTALQEQIAALEGELSGMPDKQQLLRRLERQNKTQEDLYVNLENKLAELEVQQLNRLSEFDIRIIDEAYLPGNASKDWPKWKMNLMIGAIAGLVLSLLAALLVDYFDESYLTPSSLEQDLNTPVLGCVPQVREVE